MNSKKLEEILSNIYDTGRFDQEHGSFLKDTTIEGAIDQIEASQRNNNFNLSDSERSKEGI